MVGIIKFSPRPRLIEHDLHAPAFTHIPCTAALALGLGVRLVRGVGRDGDLLGV